MTTATKRKPSKPKLPKPLESEVQKACVEIMRVFGWRVQRRNTGAMAGTHNGKRRFVRFGGVGASDLFGSVYSAFGRHFECEVKRRGERPTLDQVQWLLEASRRHEIAFWVDSPEQCRKVVLHIEAGGRIQFLDTTRTYPVLDKAGKRIGTQEGPSGDYELV